MLSPGAHLKTHCGPTNHRLRLHLPILLPPPTAGTPVSSQRTGACEMRVGAESRPWVAGRVSLFDDSYDHEVWNNATSER
jgi:aspartate beta-hydroxylase